MLRVVFVTDNPLSIKKRPQIYHRTLALLLIQRKIYCLVHPYA